MEERYVTFGMDAQGRVLSGLLRASPGGTIRMVSARKATPRSERNPRTNEYEA